MRRVLVVGNPIAHGGRAKLQFNNFLSYLGKQSNIQWQAYETVKGNDDDGIKGAINAFKPDIISIIGGDGTINDVINVSEARVRVLHLIPAGSGNDFSKLINGVMTEHECFELVLSDYRKKCDTGVCNGRYFLNGVGLGFDGSVARQTVHMKLPFSTSWKYWIAIFKNVFLYNSTYVTIKANDAVLRDKYFMIAVANGTEYGGGFRVSPLSDPSDGLLNLMAIKHIGLLNRLKYIPVVEKGKHLELDVVHQEEVEKLHISSDEILYAHLDGEIMASMSYDISVAEKIKFVTEG